MEEQKAEVEELEQEDSGGPQGRERRQYPRHALRTEATFYLLRPLATVEAMILDLSMGGCRLRLGRRIPLDIRIRVEVGFSFEGLPFRVGGVIQAVHNKEEVGIRFVDLSERNQRRIAGLIVAIEEHNERIADL